MTDVKSGPARREDAFSKAFDRTKNLDDLLQKKFEEARRKAASDPRQNPRTPRSRLKARAAGRFRLTHAEGAH